jgi:zinc transport system ATP-binding protein
VKHAPLTSGPAAELTPDADTLLSVRGAVVVRAGERLLDRVDVVVRGGETVTVVGPNGAGKSTLLRVAMGLTEPNAGSIWRQPGLRIGYVPQYFAVDATLPMTVARWLSLSSDTSPAERAANLAEVGAAGLETRALQELSGGELRRVLLARALLRRPRLLVLDEPVQGVDMAGQAELYDLIAHAAAARRAGVLMVSHELHLVMATTDRVVCLNHHVCCEGAPESVGTHPEYLALFGGLPAGMAVYTHHHDHAHAVSGAVVPLDHKHPHHHHN